MRLSLAILVVCLAVGASAVNAFEIAADELGPLMNTKSPTGRLFKRSLCNTFGGCGTKRSLDSTRYSGFRIGDESSEEQRYEADTRMISEILEDIVEHLKRDQNYQQGKYVMLVPKRTKGSPSFQTGLMDDGNRQNIRGDGIGGIHIVSD